MFKIESAKVEKRSFTREGAAREQNFNFKYRAKKGGHDFTLSNEYANMLNLDNSTAALIPSYENGQVVGVGIVFLPDGHEAGKLFVKSKKPKFNSALLEQYLAEAGEITVGEAMIGKNQKLEIEEFEDTIDIVEGEIVEGKNKLYVIVSGGEVTEDVEEGEAELEA